MSAADDDRGRDFAAFEAETRLRLAHLTEMYHRILPIHEQRSGDRAEMASLQRDVHDIKEDVGEVRKEVKTLTDTQRRMFAIFFALQVVAGIIMWALNSGVMKLGGPP